MSLIVRSSERITGATWWFSEVRSRSHGTCEAAGSAPPRTAMSRSKRSHVKWSMRTAAVSCVILTTSHDSVVSGLLANPLDRLSRIEADFWTTVLP